MLPPPFLHTIILDLIGHACSVASVVWFFATLYPEADTTEANKQQQNCSLPGSSVHGIIQTRILKWVDMPSSRGIFLTQGWNLNFLGLLPALAGRFFTIGTPWEAPDLLGSDTLLPNMKEELVLYALCLHLCLLEKGGKTLFHYKL